MFGAVPLSGSFWIRVVFTLVIHTGISVFCMYLFILVASLSCVKVNFLSQNQWMSSRPGIFQFDRFFKCCLDRFGVYVYPRAFFEHSQLCFHVIYTFPLFVMMFPFPYFLQNLLPLSRLFVGMASPILPLNVSRFVSLFWNVLFCLYCLILSRYLFSLLYFTSIFCWSSQVLYFVQVAVFFSFVRIFFNVPLQYSYLL